jgi:hypothetical protein
MFRFSQEAFLKTAQLIYQSVLDGSVDLTQGEVVELCVFRFD